MRQNYYESIVDSSIENIINRLDFSSLAGQKIFITGGTGFFGFWLLTTIKLLNKKGFDIDVCVLSRNPNKFLKNKPQFSDLPWLNFISGDVIDFDVEKSDYNLIIHAATETSKEAHSNSSKMLDDIYFGTRQILQLAKKSGTQRILLISSGAVYGSQPNNLTHQPDNSRIACDTLKSSSAYGEGKRLMEILGILASEKQKIEPIIARCFTFCGPELPLDAHFAIGNFIRDAMFKEAIYVQGDGASIRSYLYGADLAAWLLYLLKNGKTNLSYNVGSDQAISIKDLAFRVKEILAPNKPVIFNENIKNSSVGGEIYVPEIKRAREIGCEPWTSLDQSINYTFQYWNEKLS